MLACLETSSHADVGERVAIPLFTPSACLETADAAISYKVADSHHERGSAFHLLHGSYVAVGLMHPNPFGMRVMPHHLLPTTAVFVALEGQRVVGTLSLVGDGRLGLPMECAYGEEVAELRDPRRWLGEVCALASTPTETESDVNVLMNLMRLMAQFSRRHGLDHLLAAVHPRHARFYRRRLGFELFGEEKPYPTVRNRPAVALHLDLSRLEDDPPASYDLFFGEPIEEEHLHFCPISAAERWQFAPAMTYELNRMESYLFGEPLACA